MCTLIDYETFLGMEFNYSALDTVVSGESVKDSLPILIERLGASRVFIVASNSVSQATDEFAEIKVRLDSKCVGVFDQVGAHTPREDVLRVLNKVQASEADLLISIGGGSIIDCSKAVQLALDQNINSANELLEYAQLSDGSCGAKWGDFTLFEEPAKIRQIAVPTTLSGAEFSNNAGVLNTQSAAKEGYRGVNLCPQCIIYDSELATLTPEWLWHSTAIRSLDHAIEGYCSAASSPYLDAHFLEAVGLFASSLPAAKYNPLNLQARGENYQAVWLACCGLGTVPFGASHGIGYILGSLCGVPHGFTSCVMLPAVLDWNSIEFSERQKGIANALGRPDLTAGQAVKSLVKKLDLPTCLRDVGAKKSMLDEIAKRAIKHPVVKRNPRTLNSPSQVREILDIAW